MMLEQFSDAALTVWKHSSHLAAERGQKERDELHLLLAIVTLSTLGRLVLSRLGVDIEALSAQIQRMLPDVQPNAPQEEFLPMALSLKAAIEQAIICANRVEGRRVIDPALLLVGIVRLGDGTACALLTSFDVSEISILACRSYILQPRPDPPPRLNQPPDIS